MNQTIRWSVVAACVLLPPQLLAQTPANMAALQGLAPVTALPATAPGRAALAANLAVTGGIQTGVVRQPTLLPFAEQQQLALRDAFITDGNYTQLADGLGTTLAAYQARAHYLDRESYTNVSDALADLTTAFPYLSLEQANRILTETRDPAAASSTTALRSGSTPASISTRRQDGLPSLLRNEKLSGGNTLTLAPVRVEMRSLQGSRRLSAQPLACAVHLL